MSECKHTPGPWRLSDDSGTGAHVIADGGTVCMMGYPAKGCWEANARLIVTAVNSHADLLAACEGLLEKFVFHTPSWNPESLPEVLAARAAIHKPTAGGEGDIDTLPPCLEPETLGDVDALIARLSRNTKRGE